MSFPIVFQALPKWDAAYNSTSLTVAKHLSERQKVFYVEHPFSWVDSLRSHTKLQRRKREENLFDQPFKEFPNFYVIHPPKILPINFLSNGVIYKALLHSYQKKLWNRIDWVLKAYGVNKFGYINSFDPVFFDFNSSLQYLYKVYHTVDLISGEPYIAKHGINAEFEACKKADYVITTSQPLKDRLKRYNSNTECIANAADFKHFSLKKEIPIEFESTHHQKIVYTGSLGHRIDYGLIESMALEKPESHFYLIGPKHPTYFKGQKLESLANVSFLGPKNYQELPAYIQHADVLLIPFLKNELTHHIYPLKLNEYLATGNPIISTGFTDLTEFEGLITIQKDNMSVGKLLESAVRENSTLLSNRRIQFASKNTWKHRMKRWKEIVTDLEVKSFIE